MTRRSTLLWPDICSSALVICPIRAQVAPWIGGLISFCSRCSVLSSGVLHRYALKNTDLSLMMNCRQTVGMRVRRAALVRQPGLEQEFEFYYWEKSDDK